MNDEMKNKLEMLAMLSKISQPLGQMQAMQAMQGLMQLATMAQESQMKQAEMEYEMEVIGPAELAHLAAQTDATRLNSQTNYAGTKAQADTARQQLEINRSESETKKGANIAERRLFEQQLQNTADLSLGKLNPIQSSALKEAENRNQVNAAMTMAQAGRADLVPNMLQDFIPDLSPNVTNLQNTLNQKLVDFDKIANPTPQEVTEQAIYKRMLDQFSSGESFTVEDVLASLVELNLVNREQPQPETQRNRRGQPMR